MPSSFVLVGQFDAAVQIFGSDRSADDGCARRIGNASCDAGTYFLSKYRQRGKYRDSA